jgi:hypothetical protein
MATISVGLPQPVRELEVAKEKAIRVDAGLTFSQGMQSLVRMVFSSVHLTGAFRDMTKEQAKVIAMLQGPEIQRLTREQYAEVAELLEKLVELASHIIPKARSIGFPRWKPLLEIMEDQSEHLTSISETFRVACDDEELAILAEMAHSVGADCGQMTGESVGSVHA